MMPTIGSPLDVAPLEMPPNAEVRLPGSKSITNRALICASLANGETAIEGALFADDTAAMAGAVTALGARVRVRRTRAEMTVRGVDGRISLSRDQVIDARASGTTGRFIAPVAALTRQPVTIDGHQQLRDRPFGDLVDALRSLGARVEPSTGNGLPLRVTGPLHGGVTSVATDCSSQFLSGLMLAAPLTSKGLELRFEGDVVSRPYLEMTAAVMRAFGASVELTSRRVIVSTGGYVSPGAFTVEPDASAASYFWAAAAMTSGTVRVIGLDSDSIQGDASFAAVLQQMGAEVTRERGDTVVTGGPLTGVDVDLADMSDTAPTLAVAAASAQGATTVRGIGFVRGKESDRIAASVSGLRRCGVPAQELPDGFSVDPAGKPRGAVIQTHDDHRIAMAFSVLGLTVPGVRIDNPGCVDKTFPGFYETLDELRTASGSQPRSSVGGGQSRQRTA